MHVNLFPVNLKTASLLEHNLVVLRGQTRNVLLQVEKSPVMLKESLKKEEAEELKTKLEAGMLSSGPACHTAVHGSASVRPRSVCVIVVLDQSMSLLRSWTCLNGFCTQPVKQSTGCNLHHQWGFKQDSPLISHRQQD